MQSDNKYVEKSSLILPENTYLKEEGDNISSETDSKNDFLGNDSEALDIGLLGDKIENIDDFDSDNSFNLNEDDDSPDSDQKVLEDIENYRKLLSADGENLENYQFEDNRSDIKDLADSASQESNDINESDIQVKNNGIFYGKDYIEAEDKQDKLFLEGFKNFLSEKVASRHNQDDIANDYTSKELNDDADNEEEVSNNVESKEDVDTMSKEVSNENDQNNNQNHEIVEKDDDIVSKEKASNNEEAYAYDSDFDMTKEVIASDQNESQESEAIDKDDNALANDLETKAEPVESELKDNDKPEEANESDSYDDDYDNDEFTKLLGALDKISGASVEENEKNDAKPFKPIKNYEDIDDESTEEEDNSDVVNIDSNLGDIFKEADSADKLIIQTSTQGVEKEGEVIPPEGKSYGNDGIYNENPIDENADKDDENLQSVVDKSKERVRLHAVDVMAEPDAETTSKEYNEQMEDFISKLREKLDAHSIKNQDTGAPIHKTLSADQAVLIEYPGDYTTSDVYDWILDGDGAGVELNITSLNLKGDAGQYLLIIPGKCAYRNIIIFTLTKTTVVILDIHKNLRLAITDNFALQ